MRKLLVCLLALLLAAFPALGEETLETATETHSTGLAVEVTGMALLDEWDGETSQTHVFLAVYATLTNWSPETLTLADSLRAAHEALAGRRSLPADVMYFQSIGAQNRWEDTRLYKTVGGLSFYTRDGNR